MAVGEKALHCGEWNSPHKWKKRNRQDVVEMIVFRTTK